VLLAIAGGSMVTFTAMANTSLQLTAPDHLRGRVMSMYAIVMGGMTPAGALVAGTLAQFWGAPGAFAVGGLVGILSVLMVWRWRAATRLTPEPITGAAQNDRGEPGDGLTAGDGGFAPAPADEE
jgi:MFS family permease